MAKVRLELGAELDMVNKGELEDALHNSGAWEREAAFGLRQIDIPQMIGTVSAGAIKLGADQAGGIVCGPPAGWYWAIRRISVDGLASGDVVKVYKMSRFVGNVQAASGYISFGRGPCVVKSGEYLRVTGTGLSATGQITVSGEAESAPGPLMWKLIA